jgi:hypothetical protein
MSSPSSAITAITPPTSEASPSTVKFVFVTLPRHGLHDCLVCLDLDQQVVRSHGRSVRLQGVAECSTWNITASWCLSSRPRLLVLPHRGGEKGKPGIAPPRGHAACEEGEVRVAGSGGSEG